LSRPQRSFRAAGEAGLPGDDLAALLACEEAREARQQAIACYFGGGDGWRSAQAALGGAFASSAAAAVLFSGRKAE